MGKTSVDFLFSEKRGVKPTREWAELIRNNQEKYAKCKVVSFTRVKDLNSDWKHEYVQFIVEEEDSKERARMYAERGNEKDLDWVTFGPSETRQSGSKHDKDLPLPLTSFVFGGPKGDDLSKRPTVLQIAEILAAATTVGGGYELFGHSCFWYAFTTTDAVGRAFGSMATKKSWRWIDVGGVGGGGFKDAFGLGVPMLFKFVYVGDAKKFKEERETHMNWSLDGREIIDVAKVVNEVAADLQKEKYLQEYIRTMKEKDEELDKAEVQRRIAAGQENAQKEAGTGTNWTREFDELNSALVKRISADPEASSLIQVYEKYEGSSAGHDIAGEDDEEYNGPRQEQVEATHQALKIVVGRILQLASNQGELPQ